jgi:hypothetical protein
MRLLEKTYGHKIWQDSDDQKEAKKFYYKCNSDNANINAYFKNQFKGQWNSIQKHWELEGQLIDCIAMLIASEIGDLPHLSIKLIEKEKTNQSKTLIKPKSSTKMTNVKLLIAEQNIGIISPFNHTFKTKVKTQLNGKWNAKSKQWKIDLAHLDALKILINECYTNPQIQLV